MFGQFVAGKLQDAREKLAEPHGDDETFSGP